MILLNSFNPQKPDIIENQPLSQYTTLGTGGTAEFFAQPQDISQLQALIVEAGNIPVYVIGGGSNIVIPDGEIRGLVISTRRMNAITWRNDLTAEIGGGYILSSLVNTLRGKNIGGLEFTAGIPGTIGGAVSGNAGAGGHGVCEFVEGVRAVDGRGNMVEYVRGDFSYAYRECSLGGVIIASVLMTFTEGWKEDEYSVFMARRRNQPLNFRSAGCTFKNPEGNSAGKLLDECGCKGLTVGGASVSEKHANFIINCGHATSSDVMGLADLCARRVYECTGITLEPEIHTLSPCFNVP